MHKLAAEMLGTFLLVLVGTGAIVINDVSGGAITHLGISSAFGIIVFLMICALGSISGAHLNPAVTLGFYFAGRFPRKEVFSYISSQCLGALFASTLLLCLFPTHPTLGATLPSGSAHQSFLLEYFMSFVLMFVILSITSGSKEKGISVAVIIGATVGLEAFFGGPISGASMNPARSLAPALASGSLQHLWIYLLAPILGGATAVYACRCSHEKSCCPKKLAYE